MPNSDERVEQHTIIKQAFSLAINYNDFSSNNDCFQVRNQQLNIILWKHR